MEELGHLHLTFREFTTSGVIGTEEGRGGINDDEGVAVLAEDGSLLPSLLSAASFAARLFRSWSEVFSCRTGS